MSKHDSIIKAKYGKMMKELIKQTEKDGLEHGFIECDDGSIEIIESVSDSSIKAGSSCKAKMSFHTHPDVRSSRLGQLFSPADIKTAKKLNVDFHCIGFKNLGEDYEIRCGSTYDDVGKYEGMIDHLQTLKNDIETYKKVRNEAVAEGYKFIESIIKIP